MDILMNYDYAVMIVDSKGWEAFFQLLKNMYPSYHLYQVSKDWYEDDQYICKAKGARGDVVIGWEHKNYKIS
jgi:hypothetical protein